MKMFNHQADVNEVTPMPVDRVDDASTVTAVAAEALTWFFVDSLVWASATGEAAGTIVTGKLDFSGQLNSMTSSLGSTYDTSFSLGAATRFDSRVEIPEEIVSKMQFMSPTDQAATAGDYLTTNGEYYVDHRRGQVWGIAKAIVANDAASYSYGAPVVGSGGPTSNVNLDKVGGTAVTLGQKQQQLLSQLLLLQIVH